MKKWIRLLITLLILTIVFLKISIKEVIKILLSVNIAYLAISIPFIFMLYIFRTWKWEIMLHKVGIYTSFSHNYKTLLKGMFYGLATPGRAGELARAMYFDNKSMVFATVVWEKASDAIFVSILSLISIVIFFPNGNLMWLTIIASILVVIASLILLSEKIMLYIASWFPIPKEYSKEYVSYSRKFATDIRLNAKMLIPTVLYYTNCFVIGYWLLRAISPTLPAYLIFSFPLIILIGNLPISFSGIGVREGITGIIFGIANVDPAYGVTYGMLLFLMATVMPGLIGGVLHHFEA